MTQPHVLPIILLNYGITTAGHPAYRIYAILTQNLKSTLIESVRDLISYLEVWFSSKINEFYEFKILKNIIKLELFISFNKSL